MGQPNLFASIALILWIPISLVLFRSFRAPVAIALVLIGAEMFLPVGVSFDLPGAPSLNRYAVASLCAMAGCLLFHWNVLRTRRLEAIPLALMLLVVGMPIVTSLANGDPLSFGPVRLPGLTLYDGISRAFDELVYLGIPFYLGVKFFRDRRDLRVLLTILAAAGLVYSVLILFEIRMAPRLHRTLYGFHPNRFIQHVRFGGYRPMVFMPHGLAVSLFMLITAISSVGLWRARVRLGGMSHAIVGTYLAAVTVLCKGLATIAYGLVAIPLLFFASARIVVGAAVIGALLVAAYPVARAIDAVPIDRMILLAEEVDEDRARSLSGRFYQEGLLLDRARERIWTGWGFWGRSRVYDQLTGEDLSTTDGYWIITLGSVGIPGVVGRFGMLLFPIVLAARRFRWVRSRSDQFVVASVSLLLAVAAVDLLPNAWMRGTRILVGGAATGVLAAFAPDARRRVRSTRRRAGGELKVGGDEPGPKS